MILVIACSHRRGMPAVLLLSVEREPLNLSFCDSARLLELLARLSVFAIETIETTQRLLREAERRLERVALDRQVTLAFLHLAEPTLVFTPLLGELVAERRFLVDGVRMEGLDLLAERALGFGRG